MHSSRVRLLAELCPSSNVRRELSFSRSNFTSSGLLACVRCERLAGLNLGRPGHMLWQSSAARLHSTKAKAAPKSC